MEKDWSLISSFVLFFSVVIISIPPASSLSFDLSSIGQGQNLVLNPSDATSEINLTQYPMQYATGRVEYGEPLFLWDAGTGNLTDFTTRFSFVIDSFNGSEYGDGLAFFLSPFNSSKPPYSRGGFLGLFSNSSLTDDTTVAVAVEFDTFSNDWDPKGVHVGIDVDSIVSKVTAPWNADAGVRAGREATAWVSYNSTTHNLSVLVSYASDPTSTTGIFLIVDLRYVLPEMVGIGFSVTTGNLTVTHTILSWSFNSTLQHPQDDRGSKKAEVVGITVGTAAGAFVMAVVIACGLIWWWRKPGIDDALSVWFAREVSGPREFNYEVLASATTNFSPEVKLGGGGFGSVYRGQLNDRHVAIKKVARDGQQGITEYISEVTIISRLRHRNLVELVGWCHRREREEYLLVYEFMPQGSLDKHLVQRRRVHAVAAEARRRVGLGGGAPLLAQRVQAQRGAPRREAQQRDARL